MSDAGALPEILAMMAAAGCRDVEECLSRANAAEKHLGKGFHRARIELSLARGKARDRDFEQVWCHGREAARRLTWLWPPMPGTNDCPCGYLSPLAASFCGGCGTSLQTRPPRAAQLHDLRSSKPHAAASRDEPGAHR